MTTVSQATQAVSQMGTSVPSISSSAMLVELSISSWSGRKLDKTASKEITAQKHAVVGTANVNKKLLGDCAELDAVLKFAGNVRNSHYAMTMPWSDTGLRLLPTASFFDYEHQITTLRAEFTKLVETFLTAYEWEIIQAQAKLGQMFNRDEYPTTDSLRDKFRFKVNYIPLAEAGDFRLDVGNEASEVLAEKYQAYYATQLENALADVWGRAHDALTKMSERLDYSDKDTKKVFRDSLVDNVIDLLDLLDVCNVTGNTEMTTMRMQLEDTLRGVTPDGLREDEYLRLQTKRNVDAIIKTLPTLN
jgi:hypothetical protein